MQERKVFGLRLESEDANPLAVTIMTLRSGLHVAIHRTIIEGALPACGSAIVTGNHHRPEDVYKGFYACVLAGRFPNTIVKESLISRKPKESEEFLASIGGKQDEFNRYNPIRAWVLRNSGVYGINREHPGIGCIRWLDQQLASDRLAALYIQHTRHPDCLLENLQPGTAFFAKRHPDTPVYFLFSSGPPDEPDKLTISEPVTYREATQAIGKELSVGEFTVYLGDIGARIAPLRVRQDWQTRRELELQRLTAPNNKLLRRKTIEQPLQG